MDKEEADRYFAQQTAARLREREERDREQMWPLQVNETLKALAKEVVALRARVEALERELGMSKD